MRKVMRVVLGLAGSMLMAGAVHAQNPFGGLGDAVKRGAGDAAKQEVDDTVGVSGATDKVADPKGAAQDAAAGAAVDANNRAAGATQDAVGGAMGGMRQPAGSQ